MKYIYLSVINGHPGYFSKDESSSIIRTVMLVEMI